jgi:site-specific recombinase XerD
MAHGVKDLNLNPDFADFMAFITSERGLAANTRLAYEMDLGQYFEFCGNASDKTRLFSFGAYYRITSKAF